MNTMRKYLGPAAVMLSLAAVPATGFDAQGDSSVAQVEFLSGWRVDADTHMAGFRVRMKEGWHTYWRQPGDAGIPPLLEFGGSTGISGSRLHFPEPMLFDLNGMISIGYEDEVVFPVELSVIQENGAHLRGTLLIGVCEEVCIPMEFAVDAELPVTGHGKDEISRSLADGPKSASMEGLRAAECSAEAIADGIAITVSLQKPTAANPRRVVIEASDPGIWVSEPAISDLSNRIEARADMVPSDGRPFILDRSDVLITVFGDGSAIEYRGCNSGS